MLVQALAEAILREEISAQRKIKQKIHYVNLQLVYIILGTTKLNPPCVNLYSDTGPCLQFKIQSSSELGDLVASDVDSRGT